MRDSVKGLIKYYVLITPKQTELIHGLRYMRRAVVKGGEDDIADLLRKKMI